MIRNKRSDFQKKLRLSRDIEAVNNGILWLVRDLKISRQYIGAGASLAEAVKDMEHSIANFIKK